jgi:hypothetical protein
MPTKPFHIGLFTRFKSPWSEDRTRPWSKAEAQGWTDGSYYCWMAEQVERAGFDFMLLEDALMINDAYGGAYRLNLQYGCNAPRHVTAAGTRRPAHRSAREHVHHLCPTILGGSIDGNGRPHDAWAIGWNLVTSSQNRSAQNFGIELPAHDLRYDMAVEFVQEVNALQDSWDPMRACWMRRTTSPSITAMCAASSSMGGSTSAAGPSVACDRRKVAPCHARSVNPSMEWTLPASTPNSSWRTSASRIA